MRNKTYVEIDTSGTIKEKTFSEKFTNIQELNIYLTQLYYKNFEHNIYEYLKNKYIVFYLKYLNIKNIAKLPFTDDIFSSNILIFKIKEKENENTIIFKTLTEEKYLKLIDNKNNFSEDILNYSSDDFNPDTCNNDKKC